MQEFDDSKILLIGIDRNDGLQTVYVYDVQTELLQLFVPPDKGFVVEVSVSPNKKKVAYLVASNEENDKNKFECRNTHCYQYHYQINDLETNKSFNMQLFLEKLDMNLLNWDHCIAMWSEDSRFVSFQVGCNTQPHVGVVVFDTHQETIALPTLFDTSKITNIIGFSTWTQEGKLFVSSTNENQTKHIFFDPTSGSIEVVTNLPFPYTGVDSQIYEYNGEAYASSVFTLTSNIPTTYLTLANKTTQITVEYPNTQISRLKWSPTGNFLGAIFRTSDSEGVYTNYLTVLNSAGNVLHQKQLPNFLSVDINWVSDS